LTLALVQQAAGLGFQQQAGCPVGTTYAGLAAVAAALNITDITALWARFEKATDLLRENSSASSWSPCGSEPDSPSTFQEGRGLVADGLTQDISQLSQEMVDDDDSTYLGNLTEAPATPPPGGYGTPQHSQVDDEDI